MERSIHDDLLHWLTETGFPATSQVTPLKRGLGANEIWKLDAGPGQPSRVVRIFGPGAERSARRERSAMDAARTGGIPAPEIFAEGLFGNRPAMVTSFMPGRLAAEVILTEPGQADHLGTAIGEMLGRLHSLPAPADLDRPLDSWLHIAGDAIEPLRPTLAAVPDQDRLLHLDYHPQNLLVENGAISGVIDWENVHAGPPHADVARTLAILRMMELAEMVPPAVAPTIETFRTAFVAAHDRLAGQSPTSAALTAWGLAMSVNDLRRQAGKPGSPISLTALARLEAERDAMIAIALAD